jgi:hypothetical protein
VLQTILGVQRPYPCPACRGSGLTAIAAEPLRKHA